MTLVINRVWILSLALAAITGGAVQGQPSLDAQHRLGTPQKGQRNFNGVKNQKCDVCHARNTKNESELPYDLRSAGNDGWILGDELLTWSQHDHHYNAFAILRNKQSQQMAKLLGIVDEQGESLVHRDRRCLTCHSSVPFEQMPVTGDLVSIDTLQDARYTIGVSCEGCHGPAGKDASGSVGWGTAHFTVDDGAGDSQNSWRLLSGQKKFEDYGYWDIRSPDTQTRICLSCHLGSVSQRKIITHEMYAAGHPPLPSFELSQFVRQMPRHWRRFEEKPKYARIGYLKDLETVNKPPTEAEFQFTKEKNPILKATVISALVTLEESMRLTADLVENAPSPASFPELANYSCFACHHELVREGWRKSRRSTSTPGRPTLHEWPMTLARIVDTTFQPASTDSEILLESALVMSALNSQPFGSREKLIEAARHLADASGKTTGRLLNHQFETTDAHRLLHEIAVQGSSADLEYDTARLLVWAYERTLSQLNQPPTDEDGIRPPERLAVELKEFSGVAALNEFEQPLLLLLRKNRQPATPVNLTQQSTPSTRMERDIDIKQGLLRISQYDPAAVRALFERLLQEDDKR